jgi:nitronate monooxygenase
MERAVTTHGEESPVSSSAKSTLLTKLGIDLPILQAPMAGISTPELAAAVSNAGALGALGVGALRADAARAEIRKTRALTARPFHVNVFCQASPVADPAREARWLAWLAPEFARFGATPPAALTEIYASFDHDDAMLAMLLEERPHVVSVHFGIPGPAKIRALREAGIVLLASATSLGEARRVAAAGFDAVIAQGIEAGGHRGVFDPALPDEGLGTMALTRVVAREIDLPVIAAGGIMDGRGIAAALALGASAAQLGTAFVACPESSADDAFRAALRDERAMHTVITSAISGRAARGLANAFTALGARADAPPVPDYPRAYDAGKALHAAAKARGSAEMAAHWAGPGAPLARAMPAGELVRTLSVELAEAIAALRG